MFQCFETPDMGAGIFTFFFLFQFVSKRFETIESVDLEVFSKRFETIVSICFSSFTI